MSRPRKTTPKAAPCAVSLYPHEREKFKALGGSAWLRTKLSEEPDLTNDPRWPRKAPVAGKPAP